MNLLDKTGLNYLWSKIKAKIPTKTSQLTNDSGFTKNTGTVTSLTLKATGPINIDSSSAITTNGTRTISHATSGAKAGNYGDSNNQTPSFGDSFKVPYLSVNATGHVTGITEHTVKLPSEFISGTVPIGSVVEWPTEEPPQDWLICNGDLLLISDYAELYAVIGTTYNLSSDSSDSTHFRLPDYRKRVPVGYDSTSTIAETIGKTDGEENHTLTVGEMPWHGHSAAVINPNDNGYTAEEQGYTYTNSNNGVIIPLANTVYKTSKGWISSTMETPAGGSQSHNNMQPYIVQNYIIKAKQSTSIISKGIIEDNLTSTNNNNALSANQGRILNNKIDISSAPPDTSNIPKLWVDTSPTLMNTGPADLLYNNEADGEWISLLNSEKNYNNSNSSMGFSKVQTFTPNSAQNWDSWGGCYYYKKGTTVTIHIGLKLTNPGRVTIFTLPEGYRPYGALSQYGSGGTGEILKPSFIEIYDNGEVVVQSDTGYALILVQFDTITV